jgi:16S rRNA (guanine966-N2)-methyltransferase
LTLGILRITGGNLRGRKVVFPEHARFRPSEARLRQALFNIIRQELAGVQAMDLFAGSGILGIEALSQGAEFATFVEEKGYLAKALTANLRQLGLQEKTKVISGILPRILPAIEVTDKVDLVFLDPPYEYGLIAPTLEALSGVAWLNVSALVIIKHSPRERLVALPPTLSPHRERRFGDSQITILKYCGAGSS